MPDADVRPDLAGGVRAARAPQAQLRPADALVEPERSRCRAADFPQTFITLNHAGLPAQRDAESLAAWGAAMARFARCSIAVVKLYSMGVPGQRWTTGSNGWIARTGLDLFGADPAMFGSNFPVDSLCAGLAACRT